jgi:hypothetical protein
VKNTVKAVKDDTAEIHDLRQAFEKSDRAEGKQLTWASLKFPTQNLGDENTDD